MHEHRDASARSLKIPILLLLEMLKDSSVCLPTQRLENFYPSAMANTATDIYSAYGHQVK